MTRGDYFLFCLQTAIGQHPGVKGQWQLAELLEAAGDIPEEALGTESPARAAYEFVRWKLDNWPEKPKWLEAYEEGLANRVRVAPRADFEMSDQMWRNVVESLEHGGGPALPRECHVLLVADAQSIVVAREVAEQFKAWLRWLPGGDETMFTFGAP